MKRTGLTRTELLVVLGMITLLIALLLPAVNRAREAARRSQCRNNMKQFGLACWNYHECHKRLPPAFWSRTGWGWGMSLVPFIDANNLTNLAKPANGSLGDWQSNPLRGNVVRTNPPIHFCPSDSLDLQEVQPSWKRVIKGLENVTPLRAYRKTAIRVSRSSERLAIAPSNYIAVYGDDEIDCPSIVGTGLFWQNSSVSLNDDVPDGTSTSLMLGERDGSKHLAGNWAGTSYDENDPEACLDPQFVVDALVDSRPINGRDERCFSSRHSGGAHFLMADGAVRFFSEKCSTTILRRLANRADGELIADQDIDTVK